LLLSNGCNLIKQGNMNKQLRLFVGIFPSRSTQEQLNKEAENLSRKLQTKVRILAPEILHLTVKFIGNVDETQLSDLTTAFLKATGNLPSASLQIRQFRLFPSHRKPRVVAAQIERSPELDYIFQFFDCGFSYLGIVADRRSFNPHITIARARRWQKETISTVPVQLVEPITSVALIHSQLTLEGAKYNILSSVRLST
jgi:2'-5' RNA ligase